MPQNDVMRLSALTVIAMFLYPLPVSAQAAAMSEKGQRAFYDEEALEKDDRFRDWSRLWSELLGEQVTLDDFEFAFSYRVTAQPRRYEELAEVNKVSIRIPFQGRDIAFDFCRCECDPEAVVLPVERDDKTAAEISGNSGWGFMTGGWFDSDHIFVAGVNADDEYRLFIWEIDLSEYRSWRRLDLDEQLEGGLPPTQIVGFRGPPWVREEHERFGLEWRQWFNERYPDLICYR